jgi:hypothetical protein
VLVKVPEAGLEFRLTCTNDLERLESTDPDVIRRYAGMVGDKKLRVRVWLNEKYDPNRLGPEDYLDGWERANNTKEWSLHFDERFDVEGSFGTYPYAEYASGLLRELGDHPGSWTKFLLAFMVPCGACAIDVWIDGEASAEETKAIKDSLTHHVLVEGTPRDPKWSDAEARERWEKDVPPEARKDAMLPVIRTAHYIVLTNAFGGALFGKKMEENYAKIQATYPFKEHKGRRLLPIFLFRSEDQYNAFCVSTKSGWEHVSKGHASKDYYATWFESPNDPVHVHEATHQIFMNRLRLWGASWFDEGLAEYMSTSHSSRNVIAQLVVNGRAVRLPDFMKISSLLRDSSSSNTGPSGSSEHYSEAALLIEFLRESKAFKPKFPDFLKKVGGLRGGSFDEVQVAVKESLGVDVDALDKAFVEYCRKR